MRNTPLFAAIAMALSVPAAAQEAPSLDEVLEAEHRDADRARDAYRNPAETLAFFQVEPTMRVAEYGPGGGWYTRVLLPWIAPQGEYFAFQRPGGTAEDGSTWPQRFTTAIAQADWSGATPVAAFETDAIPADVAGTVDRVLIFRSLHGLLGSNQADEVLRAVRTVLADDGMVGVVQHRAPEGAAFDYVDGSNGYLRQSDVVRLFELNGFELVDSSQINANPDDPSNWPRGVWTLPPTLTLGDADRERYLAIGESDRMTLLFRKRL